MIHKDAFIHRKSDVDESATIGAHAKVWAFARILADVVIGEDCSIGGGTEIGRGSVIGDHSRIGANCFLPSNTVIGKYVFVGPGVVCTDDRHPRVPTPYDPKYVAEPPVMEDGAVIGAGVVLLPGVRIGMSAHVAAGSIVSTNVKAGERVRGMGIVARSFEPSVKAKAMGW